MTTTIRCIVGTAFLLVVGTNRVDADDVEDALVAAVFKRIRTEMKDHPSTVAIERFKEGLRERENLLQRQLEREVDRGARERTLKPLRDAWQEAVEAGKRVGLAMGGARIWAENVSIGFREERPGADRGYVEGLLRRLSDTEKQLCVEYIVLCRRKALAQVELADQIHRSFVGDGASTSARETVIKIRESYERDARCLHLVQQWLENPRRRDAINAELTRLRQEARETRAK